MPNEEHYEKYGPFGLFGAEVGVRAMHLLEEFVKPLSALDTPKRPDRYPWTESDIWSFECFRELDTTTRFLEVHEDVDGEELMELHRTFAKLRTSLPITEAEREWLWSSRRPKGPEPECYIGVTDEIVSGGLIQVIQGRDLVRRWSAWRRGQDEFTGQAQTGLERAREAASTLAEVLLIESRRPPEYAAIRVRYDDLIDDSRPAS
jgi:hypothetical protein